MGKAVYWIVIAGVVVFVGMTIFPSINTVLRGTSTDGYPYLLAAGVRALPYAVVFFIGFAAWLASRHRS